MKSLSTRKTTRYENGVPREVEDTLLVEESLLININFKPFTLTMRTPGNESELVRGLLFTENILIAASEFNYHVTEKKLGIITAVNVDIDESQLESDLLDKRNLLSVSSCGICGKIEKNEFLPTEDSLNLHKSVVVTPEFLQSMFQSMEEKQTLFQQTGGSHAVAAFNLSGENLVVMEDIGRHNAVDKVIGTLILTEELEQAHFLFVSGRVSYEIVSKAYMAQIPFLIAVSAPSSMAVELAEELGITLIAFYRDNRFSCYSNRENLTLTT